ncbi:hypothetical protein D3C87_1102450 [compost metagenome]
MARLHVQMVDPREFLSFPQIRDRKGYYLNVLTGDLFRNAGHFTEANQRILATCVCEEGDPLMRRPFLLVSECLDLSQREAKELAAQKYGVKMADLGKLVYSTE